MDEGTSLGNPRRHNVAGAPLRIGDRVRVVRGSDETFDRAYKGRAGVVEYFEYDCGCGQHYPDDPMIGIRFRDGSIEEFWAEELECSREKSRQKASS
jgi:CarS bacterial SH3 domain